MHEGMDWSGATALAFTPGAGGTYFVSVAGTDEGTGSYTVSVEEVPRGTIPRLTLVSGMPGELTVIWDQPGFGPSDYRISWAMDGDDYPSWSDAEGNAYPGGEATELTLAGLPQGVYKVRVQARYHNGGHASSPWSGPWHEATLTVAGKPTPEPAISPQQTQVEDETPALASKAEQSRAVFSLGARAAQRFTTGANPLGYVLTSVELVSEDAEGDGFPLALHAVDEDGEPDLSPEAVVAAFTPPDSFTAGALSFQSPPFTLLLGNVTLCLGHRAA